MLPGEGGKEFGFGAQALGRALCPWQPDRVHARVYSLRRQNIVSGLVAQR